MDTLSIIRPDDWHLHLRDDDLLAGTVPASAKVFNRAVIMPNLVPPVTTVAAAMEYRQRIMAALPQGHTFQPLMALYLTQTTSVNDIRQAAANPDVIGFKLYPAGATTNSDAGVTSVADMGPVFEAMEEEGVPLLVHGEVTESEIDIFDREKEFIDRHLVGIVNKHPRLKLVLEHITTKDAADFVKESHAGVGATITPQHLLMNRNDLLVGGVRPHNFCLPVLKRRTHQEALQAVAVSGSPKFFLGTDSAPHARHKKEAACGCAGCYSAPAAIELYAEFFSRMDALDKLENFASRFGAEFYGLPVNEDKITLKRSTWTVPASVQIGSEPFVPYWANEQLQWKCEN
ncbi:MULTISPECIES: dihydroorotase [Gammaproteobacteria]|uniref:dihydroorotase n=1 Tax=Gammaproteobacteria TaxID=1236 RepID=UPI000DD05374|nr:MULTISPECIES: dihydroorotase [Gammaproteobacteria]RTE86396.1 dihydroorotase [Aliidiomarina sp. B3213]TCZ91743.1 dihydroorotase [Lysobacter sp. N42]